MSTIEYPPMRFDRMNRKQAVTTCYALEDMRDRALAEIERQKAAREAEREKTRDLMEELVKAKHIIARLVEDRTKADDLLREHFGVSRRPG